MKIRNLNRYIRNTGIRTRGPRQTYDFGFGDETRGFALEVRCGRLVEKLARRKIFYQLSI